MVHVDMEWQERRSARLHIRIEPHTKQQIDEAAEEAGMTVSEFVIGSVRARVQDVLARRRAVEGVELNELMAQLDHDKAEVLDRMAADEGSTRTDVVQRLLTEALSHEDDLEADLAAIDASFGACREFEAAERTSDARDEHLAKMWQLAP